MATELVKLFNIVIEFIKSTNFLIETEDLFGFKHLLIMDYVYCYI